MKKIVSLVITAALVLSQASVTKVYAADTAKDTLKSFEKSSTSSKLLQEYKAESELFGKVYEEVKKPIPKSISIIKEEREEFSLDKSGLSSITALTALTSDKYAIVLSYADKNVHVTTADTLQTAILKAKGLANSDPNAVPSVLDNEKGLIVYATEALGRVVKVIDGQIYLPKDKNTNVYTNSLLSSAYTYINHGYVDDVPIFDDNGTTAKVEVAGYTGWLNKDIQKPEYDMMVVPLSKAFNPSYYTRENGELKHYISYDLASKDGSKYAVKIGPAPSFMQEGVKYYSYDGNYFYTSLKTLIADGKAGTHSNSVNSSNAFFNYYQYLPFRSKSTFTADQITSYLDNRAGLTATSKMRGIGQYLIDGQESNGVNALITFGVASNESASGTSSISQAKNNIFGINAIDKDPSGAALSFNSVADCIDYFTKNSFSRDYSDPDDWKHHGAFLGNKNLGANVKYASDPFWGEKAVQYMYKMDYHTSNFVVINAGSNDSISNLREFNNYQLGIYTKPTDIFSSANARGEKLYTISQDVKTGTAKVGTPVVLNGTNFYRDGATDYYKITPERSSIPWNAGGRFDGTFDWNKGAYIKTDSIQFINTVNQQNTPAPQKKGWLFENGKWYYYDLNTGAKKTGWLWEGSQWYYLDGNGTMQTGWVFLGGYWYHLQPNGAMTTGWVYDGAWYYLQSSGAMATGWLNDGGTWYYLNSSGAMQTGWLYWSGNWYYLNRSGAMQTGWVFVDGKWYYLYGSGAMAYNTTIGGYRLSGSGAMV